MSLKHITNEIAFRILRNRGINILDCGNAYDTLTYWLDHLNEGVPFSADFSAKSEENLVYVSGSGATKIDIWWRQGWTSIETHESHWGELDQEIEAARTGAPFSKWQLVKSRAADAAFERRRDMAKDFLKTGRSKEELSCALEVMREFKAHESVEEYTRLPSEVWYKFEELETLLEYLVEGTPLEMK